MGRIRNRRSVEPPEEEILGEASEAQSGWPEQDSKEKKEKEGSEKEASEKAN
jgi:hypothetical protein